VEALAEKPLASPSLPQIEGAYRRPAKASTPRISTDLQVETRLIASLPSLIIASLGLTQKIVSLLQGPV